MSVKGGVPQSDPISSRAEHQRGAYPDLDCAVFVPAVGISQVRVSAWRFAHPARASASVQLVYEA